jgi:hypothetical protein
VRRRSECIRHPKKVPPLYQVELPVRKTIASVRSGSQPSFYIVASAQLRGECLVRQRRDVDRLLRVARTRPGMDSTLTDQGEEAA